MRDIGTDNKMMARLKRFLFGTPRDELASRVDGDVPESIERLYESYGTTADSAPASASVLALGESLGHRLRKLGPGRPRSRPRRSSRRPGSGVIARRHAPVDKDGNVRWSRGLLP
jgi:hypothetical protein